MITKKEFIEIMNRLKDYNDLQEKINKLFKDNIDNKEMDFMNAGSICIGHETVVVKLLEEMFNSDMISFWMYDLDYGRKYIDGCIQDREGNIIDISTLDKLYDYLVDNMEE